MELDTINSLYLELSQVATATTGREIAMRNKIGDAREKALKLCWQIEKCGASDELTTASVMASDLSSFLNELLP